MEALLFAGIPQLIGRRAQQEESATSTRCLIPLSMRKGLVIWPLTSTVDKIPWQRILNHLIKFWLNPKTSNPMNILLCDALSKSLQISKLTKATPIDSDPTQSATFHDKWQLSMIEWHITGLLLWQMVKLSSYVDLWLGNYLKVFIKKRNRPDKILTVNLSQTSYTIRSLYSSSELETRNLARHISYSTSPNKIQISGKTYFRIQATTHLDQNSCHFALILQQWNIHQRIITLDSYSFQKNKFRNIW